MRRILLALVVFVVTTSFSIVVGYAGEGEEEVSTSRVEKQVQQSILEQMAGVKIAQYQEESVAPSEEGAIQEEEKNSEEFIQEESTDGREEIGEGNSIQEEESGESPQVEEEPSHQGE